MVPSPNPPSPSWACPKKSAQSDVAVNFAKFMVYYWRLEDAFGVPETVS
jgi:hypothetical protein